MDTNRLGGLAATRNEDGTRLKVVVVCKHGQLFDADGHFLTPGEDADSIPGEILELADRPDSTILSKWTKGTLKGRVFDHSDVAGCTSVIVEGQKKIEVPCFFYQARDHSIVLRTFGRENGDEWDKPVKIVDAQASPLPYGGTSLAAHTDESGEWIYLYYQSNGPQKPGEVIGVKLNVAGVVNTITGSATGERRLPLGSPFTVTFAAGRYDLYYTTPDDGRLGVIHGAIRVSPADPRQETMVCGSHLTVSGAHEVAEISALQQGERPIVYMVPRNNIQDTSLPSHWTNAFRIEARTLPRTPITLVAHPQEAEKATLLFSDTFGAVNVARLASHAETPVARAIPLDTMITAFAPTEGEDADGYLGRELWAYKGCLDVPAATPPYVQHGLTGDFVLLSEEKLWPTVPTSVTYYFMDGDEVQQDKVRKVVRELEAYGAVEFGELPEPVCAMVRIIFDDEDASWSFVGRASEDVNFDEATMNLSWISASDKTISPHERGLILHEFGHALGLVHEHQAPAQGGVSTEETKTVSYYAESKLGWDENSIREHVLNIYNSKEVSNFAEFDATSIMQRPLPKELSGLSYDVSYNTQLSQLDKAYMTILYPRASPHPDAATWTLKTALNKAGAPADVQRAILGVPFEDGLPNALEIRRIFFGWVEAVRLGTYYEIVEEPVISSLPTNSDELVEPIEIIEAKDAEEASNVEADDIEVPDMEPPEGYSDVSAVSLSAPASPAAEPPSPLPAAQPFEGEPIEAQPPEDPVSEAQPVEDQVSEAQPVEDQVVEEQPIEEQVVEEQPIQDPPSQPCAIVEAPEIYPDTSLERPLPLPPAETPLLPIQTTELCEYGVQDPEPVREDAAVWANQLPSAPAPPSRPFEDVIYDKLTSIFGATKSQYLALQFPSRSLDKAAFANKSASMYANFSKPTVVNEAEFRLTDDLFDVARIVSAPNGQSLSLVYEQALTNLVPKYQQDPLREQQERIRNWLLTAVDGEPFLGKSDTTEQLGDSSPNLATRSGVYGASEFAQMFNVDNRSSLGLDFHLDALNKGIAESLPLKASSKVSRIEYSQALMLDYLKERMEWEMTRDNMIEVAMESGGVKQVEQATRMLRHVTAMHENRLSAKYRDAVVRGHWHTVRELLGYLDIRSPAELLQSAKEILRESATTSFYSSKLVYPVLMQPSDWFDTLDTSFPPADLSQSVEILQVQLSQRTTALDGLNDQLSSYLFGMEGNVELFRKDVEDLTRKRDDAEAKLTKQYSAATINAAKVYLEPAELGSGKAFKAALAKDRNPPKEAMKLLSYVDLDAISKGLNVVTEAEKNLISACRALTNKVAQMEKARSSDTRSQQAILQRQITRASAEIGDLYERLEVAKLAASYRAEDASKRLQDVQLPVAYDGHWTEINLKTSVQNKTTSKTTSFRGSATSWDINLWLESAAGDSSSVDEDLEIAGHVQVDVTFRASLVTADRSSWFQPQLFGMSDAFMRASEHIHWSDWPEGLESTADVAQRIKTGPANGSVDVGESLLPAYPVGYIVAKDILVKLSASEAEGKASTAALAAKAKTSGGVLCFNFTGSSFSDFESSQVNVQEMADGLVIKIPGPQMIGYVMQLTPKDATVKYAPPEAEYYLPTDPPPAASEVRVQRSRAPSAAASPVVVVTELFSPEKGEGSTLVGESDVRGKAPSRPHSPNNATDNRPARHREGEGMRLLSVTRILRDID